MALQCDRALAHRFKIRKLGRVLSILLLPLNLHGEVEKPAAFRIVEDMCLSSAGSRGS